MWSLVQIPDPHLDAHQTLHVGFEGLSEMLECFLFRKPDLSQVVEVGVG